MSLTEQQRGNWMQTYTGRRFYPLDPRPEDVDPVDIAHALSLICRYGGHVDRFYSVAEHCILVSQAVAPEHRLWALLHDATEAYVGDMVRPLKLNMPAYRAVEDRVMAAVAARFRLRGSMPWDVKDADTRILLTERDALMSATKHPWAIEGMEPLPVRVQGLPPMSAQLDYLAELEQLLAAGGDGR